jgi:hypothetical protein
MFLWLVISDVRRLLSDTAIGEKYGDFHAVAIVGVASQAACFLYERLADLYR